MDRRKIDVGLSALLITASLIILTSDKLVEGGMETELGSLFLPRLVAIIMILLSGSIGIQSIRHLNAGKQPSSDETISTDGFGGIGLYLLMFIGYWLAVPHVGFIIATPFVMLGIAVLLEGRNWLPMIAMSISIPLIIYFLSYYVLHVYLPTWSLFQ